MSEEKKYRNWQVEIDGSNIAWLTLRYADGTTNILAYEVMLELQELVEQFSKETPKGIIIKSGYDNGFIAGANIHEFLELKTPQAAFERLRFGQQIFDKLERLSCPTVALINGFCMGGGLELVLACRYRIVLDNNKTRLGAPEILLGIHPGWGGTVRLPLLIGAPDALDLILSGRAVSAKSAKRLGLVDAVVPEREFLRAAEYYILHQPPKRKLRGWRALTNAKWVRPLLAHFIRNQVKQKANPDHYPAPYAVLKLWEHVGPHAKDAYQKEAESVSELVTHPTAENLIRVYFLQERLKKFATLHDNPPKHVHVIGSGTMGGDIAAWCALQGFRVTVFDQQLQMLANTRKRAYALFSKKLGTKFEVNYALDRLILDATTDTGVGAGVREADVIIEAVPEQLELKQKVWKIIEENAKPSALLATNTSSIPLPAITEHFKQPQRLIGIHFFNPVAAMQLVEVVTTEQTDEQSSQRAYQFLKMINHFPLPVKSAP
ncbi:MAG: 3-hydroxyacyl-CoA dehydrogenase NAD-binding domain-containing protein, partial [Gammaproteobacteria bacterium]